MSNVSALSHVMTVPQGRDAPGIWEQSPEGFMEEFIQALMSRSVPQTAQAAPAKNPPQDMGYDSAYWTVRTVLAAANIDTDVENVVNSSASEGRDDLMSLIALLTGEEGNDGFLRALEQYISENPAILETYNTYSAAAVPGQPGEAAAWLETLIEALKPEDETALPPELAPLTALWTPPEAAAAPETGETVIGGTPALVEWDITNAPSETPQAPAPIAPETAASEPQTPQTPQISQISQTSQTSQAEQAAQPPQAPPPIQTPTGITPPETQTASPYIQKPAANAAPPPHISGETPPALPEGAKVTVTLPVQAPAEGLLTGEAAEALPAPPAKPNLSYANMVARALTGTMRWTLGEANGEENRPPAAAEAPDIAVEAAQTAEAPQTVQTPDMNAFADPQSAPDEQPETSGRELPPLQSSGVAQTAQTPQSAPESAPAPRQALAQDIISQIAQNAAQPGKTTVLHVELHPKFLGKIEILLEATGGSVVAKLKSDNGAVRSLLNENIAELRESLKQAGINMNDVEVTETSIRAGLSDRQYQRHEQARQTGESPKPIRILPFAAAAAEEPEPLSPLYETGRVTAPNNETIFDYRA